MTTVKEALKQSYAEIGEVWHPLKAVVAGSVKFYPTSGLTPHRTLEAAMYVECKKSREFGVGSGAIFEARRTDEGIVEVHLINPKPEQQTVEDFAEEKMEEGVESALEADIVQALVQQGYTDISFERGLGKFCNPDMYIISNNKFVSIEVKNTIKAGAEPLAAAETLANGLWAHSATLIFKEGDIPLLSAFATEMGLGLIQFPKMNVLVKAKERTRNRAISRAYRRNAGIAQAFMDLAP